MRLSSPLGFLLNAFAVASAIPTTTNTAHGAVQSYEDWALTLPEHLRVHHAVSLLKLYNANHGQQTVQAPPTDVVRRAEMFKGLQYRVAGWVFTVSYYLVE